MIFEIDHFGITTALTEYMNNRQMLNGKEFSFHMKTSRKGLRTSRVLIKTVDSVVVPPAPPKLSEAPVEAPVKISKMPKEYSMGPEAQMPLELEVTPDPEGMEAVSVQKSTKKTPFNKLFV